MFDVSTNGTNKTQKIRGTVEGLIVPVNLAEADLDTLHGGASIMLALFNFSKPCLAKLFGDDEGQTGFEYVMLIVLVAIAGFITSPSMTG